MTKILIADDNEFPRRAAIRTMLQLGYEVKAVTNGADAILAVRQDGIALVILDLVMPPGIDGHEVIKQLGLTGPPIIVVSAAGVEVEDFQNGHVVRVFHKPDVDFVELAKAVREIIGPPVPDLRDGPRTPLGTEVKP